MESRRRDVCRDSKRLRFNDLLQQRAELIRVRFRVVSHILKHKEYHTPETWIREWSRIESDVFHRMDHAIEFLERFAPGWRIKQIKRKNSHYLVEFKHRTTSEWCRFASKQLEAVVVVFALMKHQAVLTDLLNDVKKGLDESDQKE